VVGWIDYDPILKRKPTMPHSDAIKTEFEELFERIETERRMAPKVRGYWEMYCIPVGEIAARYAAARHGEWWASRRQKWHKSMELAYNDLEQVAASYGWPRSAKISEDVKLWAVTDLDSRLATHARYMLQWMTCLVKVIPRQADNGEGPKGTS
jgi:hypothetical protein